MRRLETSPMGIRESITQIHRTYFESVVRLTAYVNDMATAIDSLRGDREALLKKIVAFRGGEQDQAPQPLGATPEPIMLSAKDTDTIIEALELARSYAGTYPELTARMSFVYLVALFDAYLFDVFYEVILHRPEVLKSGKQLSYEKALDFPSREALVEFLAKRELHELSYKSLREQVKYYEDRFGVSFEESGPSTDLLIHFRATRNLLVHNNGVVNHIYLEQLPSSRAKLGASVKVTFDYFSMAVGALGRVSDYLAATLIHKHAGESAGEP